ncbi:MAG: class I SAM-dependent methyltransferase [Candidatus Heimdallarchaeota archaeon]|nr:class I SAM-dependent methyltransferase [Candidatus Heimdallarchaeota archaeon]
MDMWKYFDITHRFHTLMNALSKDRVYELIEYLNIKEGSKVLDLGSGKGEFLFMLAEKAAIEGVGVDKSPYAHREAIERMKERKLKGHITFVENDGRTYLKDNKQNFDITMCVGASWIFDGYQGTLEAMMEITKHHGLIIIGEPYWKAEPSEDYLTRTGMKEEEYSSLSGNVEIAMDLGLRPVYTLISSLEDWDRYELLYWLGVDNHLQKYPDDEDNEELQKRSNEERMQYLEEGREIFGWALYVFRT